MVYADFGYYTSTYKGKLIPDEATFDSLIVKASGYIDYITGQKAKRGYDNSNLKDVISMTACALSDAYFDIKTKEDQIREQNTSASSNISSETVGPHSISYKGESKSNIADIEKDAKSALYSIATQYLAFTGLLYRGVITI